jgi:nucleoside-diphosphate-sugar epimerase
MKLAVTGPTGFVGKRFIAYNKQRFAMVPVSLRDRKPAELNLHGVDAVIHLAGKAHEMRQINENVYFNINYELTRQLADHARGQGVKQFIFVSSTKVYGDDAQDTLNEHSACMPTDAYGASKLKAEQYLQSIGTPRFKVSIVRPPLVYGPEVKGNMLRLMHLANKKVVLPLGNTRNARSMVFVNNLIELINTIVLKEASGTFIAGDREPVPTDKLILLIRKNLGNQSRLISLPGIVRSLIKKVKRGSYIRLFGSFVVDNSNTNRQLGFEPPYTTEQGVKAMVDWFNSSIVHGSVARKEIRQGG